MNFQLYKLYELYELYELSTQQKKLISYNQKTNKMKKSILSLVFISLFGLMSFAQGSLQFNQVRIISLDDGNVVVPEGTVWKITFASRDAVVTYVKRISYVTSGTTGCPSGTIWNTYQTVTEAVTGQGSVVINDNIILFDQVNTPVWLPSGTSVATFVSKTPAQGNTVSSRMYQLNGANICGPYNPPQIDFSGIISVIEFNIIP